MKPLSPLLLAFFLLPPIAAAQDGFRPLVEWRAYNGTDLPPTWQVDGEEINHSPGGGDLISVESFSDFELAFEWKVAPGGNSGIMYRVVETSGPPYERGPEYQILDNARHADGADPLTSAGSAYGLYGPATDRSLPAGQWNSGRIVVEGSHVEHWLNGTRVLEFEIGSDDWEARVAGSKFADWPDFGAAREGHITLQDHGSDVSFRNMRIRTLSADE